MSSTDSTHPDPLAPDKGSVRLFHPDLEALFASRPNRFLMMARSWAGEANAGSPFLEDSSTTELLSCHCPNPGRLLEFCLPGAVLYLEKRRDRPRPGGLAPKTFWKIGRAHV